MANSGPHTNGSQFFITYAPAQALDKQFCVVGRVVGGWDTLDRMEELPVAGKRHKPVADVRIRGVTIHANPFARP